MSELDIYREQAKRIVAQLSSDLIEGVDRKAAILFNEEFSWPLEIYIKGMLERGELVYNGKRCYDEIKIKISEE